jgi:DNA helicase-2/ATP-dependent DNA helicase PcrA
MTLKEYRVIGPPGTGKTSWVVRQVQQWRDKFGRDEILLASFTTTAAREIKRRGIDIEERNVGTLHAICFRILGQPALAESHTADFNEWMAQHHTTAWHLTGRSARVSDDFAVVDDSEAQSSGDAALRASQTLRARQRPQEEWSSAAREFFSFWKEWKAVAGYYDFTDLIEVCLDSFGPPNGVRIACYDEVQDFSPLELALVRKWASDLEGVVLVGDPDQSIFHFKGASPRAFLEPELPADSYRVLSKSWRVPKAVHSMAVSWINRSSWRYPFEYFPKDEDGVVERRDGAWWLSLKQADLVVKDLVAELAKGQTCMVLASCAYHLNGALRELRRAGVPYHNPFVARGDWNPLRGGVEILRAFLETIRPDLFGGERLDDLIERRRWWTPKVMWRWAQHVKAAGFFVRGGKEALKGRVDESTKWTRGLEDSELWELVLPEAFDKLLAALTAERPWEILVDLLLPDARKRCEYATAIAAARGVAALTEKPRVIVGTIHSVKGAEADVVYLSPDLSRQGMEEWVGLPAQRDVVRRVFYVGMTRAARKLVLLGRSERNAYVEWDQ